MGDAGLHLDGLVISVLGTRLVSLDERVEPGHVLTVMGPSGSGKSTLLSVIVGTVGPAFEVRGRIWLDGRDITSWSPEARRIGILFQEELLFPHLSVGGNLAFGLPPALRDRAERRGRVEMALKDVGLAGYEDRDPATLSGGQRARVALMRMLLSEPKALLLDEPFSGLDATRREQIRGLVFERARQRQLPVLLVTHDDADAEAAGGRTLHLSLRCDQKASGSISVPDGSVKRSLRSCT